MAYQRDLFDQQMDIMDQLHEQKSEPFAPMALSLDPIRSWLKAYPNATEEQRWARYQEVSDPQTNKRGTVYGDHWHREALRILGL